jgi:hypothetical protein
MASIFNISDRVSLCSDQSKLGSVVQVINKKRVGYGTFNVYKIIWDGNSIVSDDEYRRNQIFEINNNQKKQTEITIKRTKYAATKQLNRIQDRLAADTQKQYSVSNRALDSINTVSDEADIDANTFINVDAAKYEVCYI